MGQPLRLELPDMTWHIVTKTVNGHLWFLHNTALTTKILAFLAKYQEKYSVILYSCVIMGNHIHLVARFPLGNKSSFMRDWNSMVARLVCSSQNTFEGGPLWHRRYSSEMLPLDGDVENMFLYTALNPVSSGVVRKLGEYPGYNSCFEAIRGVKRTFSLIDWRTYRDRKRYNKKLQASDFETTYTLTYTRLPGYKDLDDKEYERVMRDKVEERRLRIIKEREQKGEGFLGVRKLMKQSVGAKPKKTKKSERNSFRPLVISRCKQAEKECHDLYFGKQALYHDCVRRIKEGEKDVVFPNGTYPPPLIIPFGTASKKKKED
jgi:REP element-mobilizing transposase RayT